MVLFKEKTCLLVEEENMSACRTREHVVLLDKKTGLLVEHEQCVLVEQENMSSC